MYNVYMYMYMPVQCTLDTDVHVHDQSVHSIQYNIDLWENGRKKRIESCSEEGCKGKEREIGCCLVTDTTLTFLVPTELDFICSVEATTGNYRPRPL